MYKIKKINVLLTVLLSIFYSVIASGAVTWANPGLIVTPETVKANIDKADWVVVDCRSLKDYAKGHIPGAISLGKSCKKALRDTTSRAWRDTGKYEKLLGKVGISNNSHVVFYYGDMKTINDATVGFWIMEYLGHTKTHVLNGGLDAWRKSGNRLDNKPVIKPATKFTVKLNNAAYSSTDEVLMIARGEKSNVQLIDSRTKKEHIGKDIRAIRGGNVPNTTVNISHKTTLSKAMNAKSGKMETIAYFDPETVSKSFAGLDKSKRTVAYCQTGTRSTMTYFELRLLGFEDVANWDDSWRVYGSQLEYPVANEQWFNFAGMNKKMKALEKKVSKLEKAK